MGEGESSSPRRRRRRTSVAQPERVAVWRAVSAACAGVVRHPRTFLKASWIWVILIWVVTGAVIYWTGGDFHWRPAHMLAGLRDFKREIATSGLELAVYDVLIAPFAVGWLRHVLLGNPMTGFTTLRFGGREIRFVWYTIFSSVILSLVFAAAFALCFVASVGPFLIWRAITGTVIAATPFAQAMAALAAGIGGIIALAVSARILLWAPLTALGVKGNLVARSWRLSRGNGLRLLAGGVLISILFELPIALLSGSIGLLVVTTRDISPGIGLALLMPILVLAQIAALSGFLCHATAQIGGFKLPLRMGTETRNESESVPAQA